MAGYFGKSRSLLDFSQFGHKLPADPEPGRDVRVFHFGRWMSWDEWILERAKALGKENRARPREPGRIAGAERERPGLLFDAQEDGQGDGFDDRIKRAKNPKRRLKR